MNAAYCVPIYYLLIISHLPMKPGAVMHAKIHNKNLTNTRIYYRTSQQLASGNHDHLTRNVMGILHATTTNNF
jgi:hypothetical protein